jgi:hypothetical protein
MCFDFDFGCHRFPDHQVEDLQSFINQVVTSAAPIVAGHSFGGMVFTA